MRIKDDVLRMALEGLGCRKIAEQIGCNKSSVQKILRSHGLSKGSLPVIVGTHGLPENLEPGYLSKAAEHYSRFLFLARGIEVMVPTTGDCLYDLLVDMSGSFKKIQVKSSYSQTRGTVDGYRFSLRRTRCNATGVKHDLHGKENCDYFMLVDIETRAWLIPFSLLAGVYQVAPLNRYAGFRVPGT